MALAHSALYTWRERIWMRCALLSARARFCGCGDRVNIRFYTHPVLGGCQNNSTIGTSPDPLSSLEGLVSLWRAVCLKTNFFVNLRK